MNVSQIESEYRSLYPKNSDRASEIAAPLRVMCSLSGDEDLARALDVALLRQRQKQLEMDDPMKVMKRALDSLVNQGYETVSVTQVALEMRLVLSLTLGSSFSVGFPEWTKPEWVGRKLRSEGLVDERAAGAKRIRVWGLNLRFYPVNQSLIDRVMKERIATRAQPIEKKSPADFCRVCETCQYKNLSCEIMFKRHTV